MSPSRKLQTKYLALSSVLSALGVILLYLGSILQLLDLTMVAIASLIVTFAVIEMKGRYPLMIWGVTSFLSLLLLPDKFGALCYFLLCGFYPILKPHLAEDGVQALVERKSVSSVFAPEKPTMEDIILYMVKGEKTV